MIVSIIAAVAENRIIGKDNDLIWNLPADMKFFKETTTGHAVIMGRKNYYSIPEKYRPLPGRQNIIISRQKAFEAPDCIVANSVEEGIKKAAEINPGEIFIIGGGEIFTYSITHKLANRLYITHIHHSFNGDVYFPEFDMSNWHQKTIRKYDADEKNPFPFTIVQYDRKK